LFFKCLDKVQAELCMQDWFATEQAICDIIDDAIAKYPVQTAYELNRLLRRKHPSIADRLPMVSTLRTWFIFSGSDKAARLPKPIPGGAWEAGITDKCNTRMRQTTGRKPKLFGCEDALTAAEMQLHAARHAGATFNTCSARAVLIAYMLRYGYEDRLSPHLLDAEADPDPQQFMATQNWIRIWLHSKGMTYRAVTGDAGKLPDDWERQRDDMLSRIAGKAALFNTLPEEVIHADQTCLTLEPAPEYTWNERNAKNITAAGKEAKDCVSLLVANDCEGNLLPFVLCVKGKTHGALEKFVAYDREAWGAPPANLSAYRRKQFMSQLKLRNGCELNTDKGGVPPYFQHHMGHIIVAAGEDSHFFKHGGMALFRNKLVPAALLETRATAQRGAQVGIVLLDAYSVHRAQQHRDLYQNVAQLMQLTRLPAAKRPASLVSLEFVPAKCTGKLQTADVALNRPIKAFFQQCYTNFLMKEVKEQLDAGKAPDEIDLRVSAADIAPRVIPWVLMAMEHCVENVDIKGALKSIGYDKCFSDNQMRAEGVQGLFANAELSQDDVEAELSDVGYVSMGLADDDSQQTQFYEV
jgi:hypothetical protein